MAEAQSGPPVNPPKAAGADGDYIVYVDESGDHSLASIDPNYPVFVVAFCIIKKTLYGDIVRDLLALKFGAFGHDMIVLHERDIRKRINQFAFLRDPARGPQFLAAVSSLVQNAAFTLIAAAIRKFAFVKRYAFPSHPYEIALLFCLERTYGFLKDVGQATRKTFVVVESRGSREDKDLELFFRRACAGANMWGCILPFDIVFAHKQANSTGMQLADLVARPIGQEVLAPGSQARIYPIIKSKFRSSLSGKIEGWGLKIFP